MILVCLMMVMTSCSSHSHTTADSWEVDGTGHWKICEECEEKVEAGDHTLNEEEQCTVCGGYIYDFGDSQSVYCYDAYDNLVKMADYDTEGTLISEITIEYEYDADGNVTREKQYVDGVLSDETEYVVSNGESQPVKYTGYYEDGTWFINEYDSHGNVVVMISYDADGNIEWQSNSEYAENSEGEWYEIKCTEISSDGTKYVYEYNEDGDLLNTTEYDADGNLVE